MRVLVVDDDVPVANALRRALRSSGAEVFVAYSAADALKVLREVRPHVVVSDYRMPEMTGAELLEEIKLRGFTVAGVILTGDVDEATRDPRVQSHRWPIRTKPWNDQDLVALISGFAPCRVTPPPC